jgi:DNA-binding transcriptional LysR family regulator
MANVDTGQLRCFVKAVESRSLSEAAKALDISQPAISKKLQKLEHALGTVLLERTAKGVRPTIFGSTYYSHARAVLSQLERGSLEIQRLKSQGPAQLSIGAVPSLMESILPAALSRFIIEWPSVHFDVVHDDHVELIASLQHGELDAVLSVSGTIESVDDIEHVTVAKSVHRAYVRRDHPLAKARHVSLEQLQASRWILHDKRLFRDAFKAMFEAASLPAPKPVILSRSLRFLNCMIQEADLVAFMPEHMAQPAVDDNRLVPVAFDFEAWAHDICIYYRHHFAESAALKSLTEHIQIVCDARVPTQDKYLQETRSESRRSRVSRLRK